MSWARVFFLFAMGVAGCDDAAPSPAGSAAPPSKSPSTAASAPSTPSVNTSANAVLRRLEIQRFELTSGIEKREPVDMLDSVVAGERVYAFGAVRNRTGGARRVSLLFRVGGVERSTVDLQIEPSWSFRTWGYVTLRDGDRGVLGVELRDEHGDLLSEKKVPIRAAKNTAPR